MSGAKLLKVNLLLCILGKILNIMSNAPSIIVCRGRGKSKTLVSGLDCKIKEI